MELREAVMEFQEANTQLRRKCSDLSGKLSFKESLIFNSPFYYAEGDEIPCCARCWEAQGTAVHLPPPFQSSAGTKYTGVLCKTLLIHPR